jgi:hypothetical protein
MSKRDFTQIAKGIIDQVTGDAPPEPPDTRNPHAVELSKLGASKGGKARAEKLSRPKKRQIARKAAEARWKKKKVWAGQDLNDS